MPPASPEPFRIALVGVGKIARDQHRPVIDAHPDFECVATVSTRSRLDGVPAFASIEALRADGPHCDAVAICTPPQARHALARSALLAGWDVLLEKPPCATLGAIDVLRRLAQDRGAVLYATWHSRHAPAIGAARRWLASRTAARVQVTWAEDVRQWHPDQEWIWQPGGLGVFDPGINALSILTDLLPAFVLRDAELSFPSNRDTPIAARLRWDIDGGGEIDACFDWRHIGAPAWDIEIETDAGHRLTLVDGGTSLSIDGVAQAPAGHGLGSEYEAIYDRFAECVRQRVTDLDPRPLQQIADAFMIGRRVQVAPFL